MVTMTLNEDNKRDTDIKNRLGLWENARVG